MKKLTLLTLISSLTIVFSCNDDDDGPVINDPATATEVSVDRFSADAGMLMVRDGSNGLPAANEPINYDSGEPFITQGLGPDGQVVEYYNFDVQPTAPAPIYVLFREGETTPVSGQLNIINVIPGDEGYNDFWQVVRVTVPADYVANEASSFDELLAGSYAMETTTMLVNCPVVPKGSTASKRLGGESNGLVMGWYKRELVYYFTFSESSLSTDGGGMVPLSPIYVTFNENPPSGGPASGFRSEMGSAQTHNVIATTPTDQTYSPLWVVNVYDNSDFESVSDLMSAQSASILASGVANVNCPVVANN